MKERPILFQGEMVRAILAGRKTQTRRLIRDGLAVTDVCGGGVEPAVWWPRDAVGRDAASPYGVPGDRLWVKETFYCDHCEYPTGPRREMVEMLEYRATHDCSAWEAGCPCRDDNGRSSWRPSIFMPRWASRLTLDVTEVRVERLQDITEADARAEGVEPRDGDGHRGYQPARAAYAELWDRINGEGSWLRDPWVWVVGFKPAAPETKGGGR